ncbi:MAG TPA: iron export ABC transporter permease subunit FetB [Caldisericia bacterium]|jgi:putative ABC transport system permease protein|nr:iron export ABC transporter permease subunit FetB [Caldisericia bacterium]HXK51470.1 iron export ABC transporter permease subunit FetB [Caldisericia bacterium]
MSDIDLIRLIIAYSLILMLYLFMKIRRIQQDKLLIVASFRMTIQLVLAGYLLRFIFQMHNTWLTLGIILLMVTFAVLNVRKLAQKRLTSSMVKSIVVSLSTGTLLVLVFFLLAVVNPPSLFDPRYWIPLAGMIIGNAMTGISIGLKTLLDNVESNKDQIQTSLHLGAQPQEAIRSIVNKSFEAAILPTLNSMLGMGIIFLPGMMSGQIIAGSSPITAIRYQIGIMLGISGSVSLSIFLFSITIWKSFFNAKKQFTP